MHSAGPRTLAADRSVYALWPLAAGCHTIDYYYYYKMLHHSHGHCYAVTPQAHEHSSGEQFTA